ncbi:MAG: thiamine pyrophosphate-dependent enzyme, partial [Alphaproteobacteria bacterium]|nr:thiamine pyrophosphate-dependent enzyme [Alphaproteobacteria bacterium]
MEEINYPDHGQFFSGHVACGGCVEALSLRVILNTVGVDAVAVVPPSCTAVICGGYPFSSVKIPVFHSTLESSAASASGVKRALLAKGKPDTTVLCLAGDGGTYDIGLQALSSAAERNEDILYICFD